MDFLTTIFSCFISLLPILLILRRPDIKLSWLFLLHFVVLFTLTEMALGLGGDLQVKLAPELKWNWLGKVLGIIVSMGYYLLFLRRTITTEMVGLRWYVDTPTLRGVVIAGMVLVVAKAAGNLYSSTKEIVTLESYLYQATLPGLQEELLYRGFLLAILQLAFNRVAVRFLGFTLDLWIVSLLFALGHSFSLTNHFGIHFNYGGFGYALVSGMVFAWIRVKSGSLVMPVVFHNLSNVMIMVANAIK